MEEKQHVAVFGASGHTGRFVVAELRERGYVPLLLGRDPAKLRAEPGSQARRASADDPASLDRALDGAAAVINCAGPFAATAAPVIEAALRAGIPYLDVAAELEANVDTFAHFAERARAADTLVVPAMAFYGGLGDLLVTTAMGDWTAADEAHIAYGLSSWHPTAGTLASGVVSDRRRGGRRVRFTGGRLEYHDDARPTLEWPFPAPLGPQNVLGEFTMADAVTVPSHLAIPEVCTYMTVKAAADLSAPNAQAPAAVDERGRSAQTFVVDVLVRSGGVERRIAATGQDIYAITAPLVVEAVDRVLTGRTSATGVASAGAAFDAPDFLRALSAHLSLDFLDAPLDTHSGHRRGGGGDAARSGDDESAHLPPFAAGLLLRPDARPTARPGTRPGAALPGGHVPRHRPGHAGLR
nr:NAD(P)H-binding protein [Herbidospora solisilvae]